MLYFLLSAAKCANIFPNLIFTMFANKFALNICFSVTLRFGLDNRFLTKLFDLHSLYL